MATQKQIDANRENAKKSTGPTTEEGKARSSMNGFKSHFTGLTTIMADEDSDARAEFVVKLIDDWAPKGPIERQLATTIALDNWRLNRIKTVEENIFAFDLVLPDKVYNHERIEVENALGHVLTYIKRSREIDRISLYESRLNKIIAKNMDLLEKRQAARKADEKKEDKPTAQPEKTQHFTASATTAGTDNPLIATNAAPQEGFAGQNGFAPASSESAPVPTPAPAPQQDLAA